MWSVEVCGLDVPSLWPLLFIIPMLPCAPLFMVMSALEHTTLYPKRFFQYTSSSILLCVSRMRSYFPSCTNQSTYVYKATAVLDIIRPEIQPRGAGHPELQWRRRGYFFNTVAAMAE